jgi:fluoride exporter
MKHYLLVGLGAAFGAMSRFGMAQILPASIYNIPLQILTVNILGCFLMGLLSTALETIHISYSLKLLLLTGFLGGFTTFSSFALDFGLLTEKNATGSALIYAFLSVTLSILAFFIGLKIIKLILQP